MRTILIYGFINQLYMVKLVQLIIVSLIPFLFFCCQDDFEQIEEEEKVALLNVSASYENPHIGVVLDREGSPVSDQAWEKIYAELNFCWARYPEIKNVTLDMKGVLYKVKFRFEPDNPNLTALNPAYYEVETKTIVIKSEQYIQKEAVILHEFLHAAQHATMGRDYMSKSVMRNLEFEIALMLDLLVGRVRYGCDLNSPQEKKEYGNWWMDIYAKKNLIYISRFNEFAEKFYLYQDVQFQASFKPSFLIKYWWNYEKY